MKLHFEPDLDYQLDAIESVCDLFRGQELGRSEFAVTTIAATGQTPLALTDNGPGIGNQLLLSDEQILANLRQMQLRNGLPPSDWLESGDFTVEMETGTGKTYVYLRTALELHRRYGFSKFVIVVPSIAIKEGVFKSLQMTEQHLRNLYNGTPFDYFVYDSKNLGQVRTFATDPHLHFMVVTVGAINKLDVNKLYATSDQIMGDKPIDLVRATNPVLIVDEPQSVDGGLQGRGRKALAAMNPLCTLRYSATHTEKHHMVYRLDAVDAYERKLVKQIEVAAATVEEANNRPFVRLVEVQSTSRGVSAKVELDVQTSSGVRRKLETVHDGDNLDEITNRPIYANCVVGEIRSEGDQSFMELRVPGGEVYLAPGEAWGEVDRREVHREMIRRTIREHFDKERRLRDKGVKVLSLFFIDQVAKYRSYDEDNRAQKGEYAKIFEEEFQRLAKSPIYRELFPEGTDFAVAAAEAHNGYFSIDKKGGWTDTAENNNTNRENAERAYNLIMKEKEKLLSFETPLRFIFSHSALREGWDNPNVFQICTIRDIQTERERRQTIGRGLRLCVNQDGQRLRGFDINTLTVVATESYEQFAENLQREIEAETGIRFGVVEAHQFAGVQTLNNQGELQPLGFDLSNQLWTHLQAVGYLDAQGKIQDSLREALRAGTLELPEEFSEQLAQVTEILRRIAGRLEIKNADERRPVQVRHAVLCSPEFEELWNRIKFKTTYRLRFDNENLIAECIEALRNVPRVTRTTLQWRKASIGISRADVEATEIPGASITQLDESDYELPDLLAVLQDRTQLTRRSLLRILRESGRLSEFTRNPQQFIETAVEAINRCKRFALISGIKYQRIGDQHYYAQSLFEDRELTGYIKKMVESKKSVYEHVVWESSIEHDFATALENNTSIMVYAKLPGWFEVPTPLGGYNPDWAILVEQDGEERLYFVVETKGSLYADDLRRKEGAKIVCGRAHFNALAAGENPAHYQVARTLNDLLRTVQG